MARPARSRPTSPAGGAAGRRAAPLAAPAGRTRPAGISRYVSSSIGNEPKRLATASRSAARWRICHSGVRASPRRRGSSKRARGVLAEMRGEHAPSHPARAPPGPRPRRGRGTAGRRSGRPRGLPADARRCRRRSRCTYRSTPRRSRTAAAMASAHGACTRPPNGVRMHTRQSPSSSRKRSTTICRSLGTTPVLSFCSLR